MPADFLKYVEQLNAERGFQHMTPPRSRVPIPPMPGTPGKAKLLAQPREIIERQPTRDGPGTEGQYLTVRYPGPGVFIDAFLTMATDVGCSAEVLAAEIGYDLNAVPGSGDGRQLLSLMQKRQRRIEHGAETRGACDLRPAIAKLQLRLNGTWGTP